MNTTDLLAALLPVLAALEHLGIRHFVGGSVATSALAMVFADGSAPVGLYWRRFQNLRERPIAGREKGP